MRLTYVVLVAIAVILACCDGSPVMSDSKRLTMPQGHVQTENNNNRFLRVHQEVADVEEEDEERAPQLTKSLSEKFLTKAAEKVAGELRKSKSFNELSKLDDAYYAKALAGNEAPQLTKSFSEKFPAEKAAGRLRKSKSFNELSKLDDVYYAKALDANENIVFKNNEAVFQRIENMGYNPDIMLTKMKQLDGDIISPRYSTLLDHYTTYWMAKYPTWASKSTLHTTQ